MNATERDLAIESYTYPSGTEIWYLAQAIRRRGARAQFIFDADAIPPSSIAGVKMGGGHFIAIEESTADKITFVDPLTGEATTTPAQLRARYHFTGMFLLVRPRAN